MNFRQLEYFLTIAEERSFSKAAKRLFVSQPAVTQQIQALEEDIGVQLFYRSNRAVQLTNAGERFCQDVQELKQGLEQAVKRAQTVEAAANNTLAIYYHTSDGELFYPRVLPLLKKVCPQLEIEYVRDSPRACIEAVAQGLAHFCFARRDWITPELMAQTEAHTVMVDRECCLMTAGHSLSKRRMLSYGDLSGYKLLIYNVYPVIQKEMRIIKELAPGVEVIPMDSDREVENLVRTGMYAAVWAHSTSTEDDKWIKVPLQEGLIYEICAVTGKNPSAHAKLLRDISVAEFQSLNTPPMA